MMHKRNSLIILLCLLGICLSLTAQGTVADANELIKTAEKVMYPNARVSASLSFSDGKGRSDSYGLTFYTRDRNQKIIVRFTSPSSWVGNDLLMIEQNVWAFDKRSNRVMKIPSNQTFGGSGFSYGDVVRLNFSDNYSAAIMGQTESEWQLELLAKDRNAPYFRIELTIAKKGGWPLKGSCFAKSGAVVKDMVYANVADIGTGRKPLTLTVTSPANPGETTIMTLLREDTKELPDRIFNKRNLETRLEETL